jgi:Fic family protein
VADWEANSPQLVENLQELGRRIATDAASRQPLSSGVVREWHAHILRGLESVGGEPSGRYRGETGLEEYDVAVGGRPGAPAARVAGELRAFDDTLTAQLEALDRTIRREHLEDDLTADTVHAVLILCAWAHGEWVRIHPFPNANGRMARLLVNSIALRYGLPAFLRLRPRPGRDYAWVAQQAMTGHWEAAVPLFARLYEAALPPGR